MFLRRCALLPVDRFAAQLIDQCNCFLGAIKINISYADFGAIVREHQCRCSTDAIAGTGYQTNFVFE